MSDSLVIIPTYNEKENIQAILSEILALEPDFDVLIVDDNSPDGTANLVVESQGLFPERIHLLKRPEKNGLGTAYITGFNYALDRDYQYIFEMDADFSHSPRDLVSLLDTCKNEGFDMAVGSRYVKGVNVVNWPLGRVLMSYLASVYVKIVTGLPISDATAGFKCYRRKVLETISLESIKFVGYAFQIEMKFKAWKYGFKIKEVPIIFINRQQGESKMSTGIFKEAFFGVVQMKFASFFKKYTRVN